MVSYHKGRSVMVGVVFVVDNFVATQLMTHFSFIGTSFRLFTFVLVLKCVAGGSKFETPEWVIV